MFAAKLSRKHRVLIYPLPQHIHSPPHCRHSAPEWYVTVNEPTFTHCYLLSPYLPLGPLGVVHYMGLDKCIKSLSTITVL